MGLSESKKDLNAETKKDLNAETKKDPNEYDIFVSFHPNIFNQVENIHDKLLKRYKFKIWPEVLSLNDIEPSNHDSIKIIKNATIFLCFVTQAYCFSERCLEEIELANKTHARIIFAIVEKIENENLGGLEVIINKAIRKNILKCYDSKSDWWIEKFEQLKELILQVKVITKGFLMAEN